MTQPNTEAVRALIASGKVTAEQVREAEQIAQNTGTALINTLVSHQFITNVDAIRVVTEAAGVEFVELTDYPVDPGAVMRLSGVSARRWHVMPLAMRHGRMVVAVSPSQAGDVTLKDDLTRLVGCKVDMVVALKSDIAAKIEAVYRAEGEIGELASEMIEDQAEDIELGGLVDVADDAPIVRFVNLIIQQAITDRASDIHIEPHDQELVVRYRIDGVLHTSLKQPISMARRVISRLKIMAELNIAETRLPQDGRLMTIHNGKKIGLRVATLPTVGGIEGVVMRILDNSTAMLSLNDLGFAPHNFETFARSYSKPYGMILVTGPTGSGKSTTLYSTLNIVSDPTKKVITVEDPVEYRIPGINQIQVNNKAGLDFPKALRTILRSDPDIILIGEIRDHETAQIAIEAALTGHLVLSTLHTNDAPSAITRLTEMGIEPFLVGSALDGVLAQRLCRRLCPKCKEAYTPDAEDLTRVGYPWDPSEPLPQLYRAGKCSSCTGTGYRGRMGLHEVMEVTEEIERLAVARASAADINRVAVANGMRVLRHDGWLKVSQGMTSIEEILRVIA